MTTWIFQADPDRFSLDGYLRSGAEVRWIVRRDHLAQQMSAGDRCYIWRAGGTDAKESAGIVASGTIVSSPEVQPEDPGALRYWTMPPAGEELRVRLRLDRVALKKEVIQRKWLQDDPVLKDLRILPPAAETNHRVYPAHEARLADLWRNTGRAWDERESLAGLWAYAHTNGKEVSRKPGSPVADVAVRIGRAVTGVYNKVMNFRALDPADARKGLSGGGETDRAVWEKYFDPTSRTLDVRRIDDDYAATWTALSAPPAPRLSMGTAYRRADENVSLAAPQPNESDPALMERGTRGHRRTQNALADFLTERGITPISPNGEPSFDVAWQHEGAMFVAEVKSVTDRNEESQLRLGLGQVLRYRHQLHLGELPVIAVLVTERQPTDPRWVELCESLGVHLVWPPFRGLADS
jgi:hypothetical protein